MTDNRFIPGVTDEGPTRAAKGGFPYPGHGAAGDDFRCRIQQWSDDEKRAAGMRGWVDAYWPHLGRYGYWRPSRYNSKRGQWQVQVTRTYRSYIFGGMTPREVRTLDPAVLVGRRKAG